MIKVYNSQTQQWQNAKSKIYRNNTWRDALCYTYDHPYNKWIPAFIRDDDAIYGIEYDIANKTTVRTDESLVYDQYYQPVPYTPDETRFPSSPYDFIMPWAGMRLMYSENIGTFVMIPRFYYKITKTSSKIKIQISRTQQTGFLPSPAHSNTRLGYAHGDVAEWVGVGAYLSSGSNRKSVSGQSPSRYSIDTQRARIGQGSNILYGAYDFSMHYTIAMLCMIEYGTLSPETIIGYASGHESGTTELTGATDSMPYHTGSIAQYTQYIDGRMRYRYIEDLWRNSNLGGVFTDGARRMESETGRPIIGTVDPDYYAALSNGQIIGNIVQLAASSPTINPEVASSESWNVITDFVFSGATNNEFFPIPSAFHEYAGIAAYNIYDFMDYPPRDPHTWYLTGANIGTHPADKTGLMGVDGISDMDANYATMLMRVQVRPQLR